MALILSLRQGEDFFLGQERVMVRKVYSNKHFVLETSEGTHYEIVQDRMAEVAPDVFISSGDRGLNGVVRIVIDAPRDIIILRGQAYRRAQG
jgi:sRNA-binding carbon storage regulator CsrA